MIEALLQAERLLVHGMVDQAEQIYSGAVAKDPNNAIAVVGLARVALERGDEQLAYERAQAALRIDPQNPAALRLEARLAEVFEARGEQHSAAEPGAEPGPPEPMLTPDARPSEQAVFTRNPTMAEHQRMEQSQSDEGARSYDHLPPDNEQPPEPLEPPEHRPGLFRRLMGE